jgi:hypothetical protein
MRENLLCSSFIRHLCHKQQPSIHNERELDVTKVSERPLILLIARCFRKTEHMAPQSLTQPTNHQRNPFRPRIGPACRITDRAQPKDHQFALRVVTGTKQESHLTWGRRLERGGTGRRGSGGGLGSGLWIPPPLLPEPRALRAPPSSSSACGGSDEKVVEERGEKLLVGGGTAFIIAATWSRRPRGLG